MITESPAFVLLRRGKRDGSSAQGSRGMGKTLLWLPEFDDSGRVVGYSAVTAQKPACRVNFKTDLLK